MKKKIIIFGIVLFAAAGVVCIFWHPSFFGVPKEQKIEAYVSEKFGLRFVVPKGYFVAKEVDESTGERKRYSIILMEDSAESRAFLAGEYPGTEFPPTITIGVFQNDQDHHTPRQFVEGTSFSNFKLSDGRLSDVSAGGRQGLRYHATGLYENENIVVATPEFVYMLTVFFNTPTDKIVSAFEDLVKTTVFL